MTSISKYLHINELDLNLLRIEPSAVDPLPYIRTVHPESHINQVEKQAFSKSRIVSVLEGGYNPKGLASAVGAHLRALLHA
jgi:acetoin utilization deacetylase AcuC-like enzyme